MKGRIKSWLVNQIKKQDERVKNIDYAIYMYGCDAWGSSAFSNIEKMNRLREERKSLVRKRAVYSDFSKLLTA